MIYAPQPSGGVFKFRPRRRSRGHIDSHGFKRARCAASRVAGLLAVGLPMFAGLSGCADDAFLVRDASPVDIPVPATPSAARVPAKVPAQATAQVPAQATAQVPARVPAAQVPAQVPAQATAQTTADEPGANTVPAAESQARRYFAAIGRVLLENHAGDDFFSSPDIFVQVQRRDPEVLGSVRLAEERQAALSGRLRAAEEELRPLRAKQQASELTPGEPLSPTQVARLDELSRDLGDVCDDPSRRASCAMCSRYDERPVCVQCEACNERRFLEDKKAASEIVPGPELSPEERGRLEELEGAIARIATDRGETGREIARLRESITGHTHTITTPGYIVDFGGRAIQEVFPGDEVWIAVYDRDAGEHDLYGSTALRIGDALLRGGDVELAMPNVESLVLRIVSP